MRNDKPIQGVNRFEITTDSEWQSIYGDTIHVTSIRIDSELKMAADSGWRLIRNSN